MASSEPGKPSLPGVPDLLDVLVPAGTPVLAISDLHLPPRRTGDSARTCGVLAARLAAEPGPVTVVLAGDVIELLGFPRPPQRRSCASTRPCAPPSSR